MDKILKQSLLYDFYGELLTPNQKNIYEQYLVEDLSISEIAANQSVSRQGVHDTIKRCESILEDYENKLQLVKRFISIRNNVYKIEELLNRYSADDIDNSEQNHEEARIDVSENEGVALKTLADEIRKLSQKIIIDL